MTRAALVDGLTDMLVHPRAFAPDVTGEPGASEGMSVRAGLMAAARARVVERLQTTGRLDEARTIDDAESQAAGFDELSPEGSVSGLPQAPAADAGASASRAEAGRLVWRAAASLTARQYVALDMRWRQGLEGQALARALGVARASSDAALAGAEGALRGLAWTEALVTAARGDAAPCPQMAALARQIGEAPSLDQWLTIERHASACPVCGERLDQVRQPGEVLAHLAPTPMPVELRRAVWRDLAARWPDDEQTHEPTASAPLAAAGAALEALTGRASAGLSSPAPTIAAGTEAVPAAEAPTEELPTLTDDELARYAPDSPYVRSRAASELLARTRQARLPEGTAPNTPPVRPQWMVDESALSPGRPVRLRTHPGARIGRWLLIAAGLFAIGTGVGLATGGSTVVEPLIRGIFRPAALERDVGSDAPLVPTPTTAAQPTPAAAKPAAAGDAAGQVGSAAPGAQVGTAATSAPLGNAASAPVGPTTSATAAPPTATATAEASATAPATPTTAMGTGPPPRGGTPTGVAATASAQAPASTTAVATAEAATATVTPPPATTTPTQTVTPTPTRPPPTATRPPPTATAPPTEPPTEPAGAAPTAGRPLLIPVTPAPRR